MERDWQGDVYVKAGYKEIKERRKRIEKLYEREIGRRRRRRRSRSRREAGGKEEGRRRKEGKGGGRERKEGSCVN